MAEFSLFLPDGIAAILGSVDDQGILTFAIHAQPQSPIRGTEMFDLMMRAFESRVQAILGVWRYGTNFDRVNERTGAGTSLQEAIEQTWTFTRASRWGYGKVIRVDCEGTPGKYTKIDVLIGKGEVTHEQIHG